MLRSSIREFLVQEAMHWLGVPTTRGVSLIVSEQETVPRAWYNSEAQPSKHGFPPNTLVEEKCAIATRASSSFIRVGHFELFTRRINADKTAIARLKILIKHCIKREFPEISPESIGPPEIVQMVQAFSKRQAKLVTNWIRVGYVQGNMNSDNCLLAGRTMDYGPFGFVEQVICSTRMGFRFKYSCCVVPSIMDSVYE